MSRGLSLHVEHGHQDGTVAGVSSVSAQAGPSSLAPLSLQAPKRLSTAGAAPGLSPAPEVLTLRSPGQPTASTAAAAAGSQPAPAAPSASSAAMLTAQLRSLSSSLAPSVGSSPLAGMPLLRIRAPPGAPLVSERQGGLPLAEHHPRLMQHAHAGRVASRASPSLTPMAARAASDSPVGEGDGAVGVVPTVRQADDGVSGRAGSPAGMGRLVTETLQSMSHSQADSRSNSRTHSHSRAPSSGSESSAEHRAPAQMGDLLASSVPLAAAAVIAQAQALAQYGQHQGLDRSGSRPRHRSRHSHSGAGGAHTNAWSDEERYCHHDEHVAAMEGSSGDSRYTATATATAHTDAPVHGHAARGRHRGRSGAAQMQRQQSAESGASATVGPNGMPLMRAGSHWSMASVDSEALHRDGLTSQQQPEAASVTLAGGSRGPSPSPARGPRSPTGNRSAGFHGSGAAASGAQPATMPLRTSPAASPAASPHLGAAAAASSPPLGLRISARPLAPQAAATAAAPLYTGLTSTPHHRDNPHQMRMPAGGGMLSPLPEGDGSGFFTPTPAASEGQAPSSRESGGDDAGDGSLDRYSRRGHSGQRHNAGDDDDAGGDFYGADAEADASPQVGWESTRAPYDSGRNAQDEAAASPTVGWESGREEIVAQAPVRSGQPTQPIGAGGISSSGLGGVARLQFKQHTQGLSLPASQAMASGAMSPVEAVGQSTGFVQQLYAPPGWSALAGISSAARPSAKASGLGGLTATAAASASAGTAVAGASESSAARFRMPDVVVAARNKAMMRAASSHTAAASGSVAGPSAGSYYPQPAASSALQRWQNAVSTTHGAASDLSALTDRDRDDRLGLGAAARAASGGQSGAAISSESPPQPRRLSMGGGLHDQAVGVAGGGADFGLGAGSPFLRKHVHIGAAASLAALSGGSELVRASGHARRLTSSSSGSDLDEADHHHDGGYDDDDVPYSGRFSDDETPRDHRGRCLPVDARTLAQAASAAADPQAASAAAGPQAAAVASGAALAADAAPRRQSSVGSAVAVSAAADAVAAQYHRGNGDSESESPPREPPLSARQPVPPAGAPRLKVQMRQMRGCGSAGGLAAASGGGVVGAGGSGVEAIGRVVPMARLRAGHRGAARAQAAAASADLPVAAPAGRAAPPAASTTVSAVSAAAAAASPMVMQPASARTGGTGVGSVPQTGLSGSPSRSSLDGPGTGAAADPEAAAAAAARARLGITPGLKEARVALASQHSVGVANLSRHAEMFASPAASPAPAAGDDGSGALAGIAPRRASATSLASPGFASAIARPNHRRGSI